jgi:hypothetical protein
MISACLVGMMSRSRPGNSTYVGSPRPSSAARLNMRCTPVPHCSTLPASQNARAITWLRIRDVPRRIWATRQAERVSREFSLGPEGRCAERGVDDERGAAPVLAGVERGGVATAPYALVVAGQESLCHTCHAPVPPSRYGARSASLTLVVGS